MVLFREPLPDGRGSFSRFRITVIYLEFSHFPMDVPAPQILRHSNTFTSARAPGVTFHRTSAAPADSTHVRARLAIVHGYGDHSGRYADVMTWLAGHGIACHAFDLRGHGLSSGRRAYVRHWDEYLDDVDAFLALPEFRQSPGDPPVFVLGHSHGGLVVAVAGIRGRISSAGYILSAPYFANGLYVPAVKSAAAKVLNIVLPWVRIKSGIGPAMGSSDPVMVEESRHDPLLLRSATPRWYIEHKRAQAEAIARAADFTLPLLVFCGDADPVADPRGAAAFHAAAGSADKTLVAYPGFLHEPMRDAGRAQVYADVLGWIDRRAADATAVAQDLSAHGSRLAT